MPGAKHALTCCRMAFFLNTKLQLEIVQFLNTPSAVAGSAALAFLRDPVTLRPLKVCSRMS